jgi:RNA polymerase sigma factor (sigma-70 family)
MKRQITDEEIISGLKSCNERLKDNILSHLYKEYYSEMTNYIIFNHKLNLHEAQDLFQDGMIDFYENVVNEKFNRQSGIKTYLFSIMKFKTLNKINSTQQIGYYEDYKKEIDNISVPFDSNNNDSKAGLLNEIMNKLGETCKNVLVDYYYNKNSMTEIAGKYNFSDEKSAKTQKYKCLKKLMEYVNSKPMLMEQLRN